MHSLDQSFAEPERNLACDEALLDWCDNHQEGIIRFWESPVHFVVLGYSNRLAKEVDRDACERLRIPIYRRCSGGGTVLQGPGCLNYSLTLPLDLHPDLSTVAGSNHYIMQVNCNALTLLLTGRIAVDGHTDLAWNGKKFSGNAQRRTRKSLLFHGTFLLKFDLPLIEQTLRMPLLQPDYRKQRDHLDFVTNLPLTPLIVKGALRQAWKAGTRFKPSLTRAIDTLVSEKYAFPDWNEKF